jgi:hypothetical protein
VTASRVARSLGPRRAKDDLNGPLTQGRVWSVASGGATCSVVLDGQTFDATHAIPGVKALASYGPVAGDNVWVYRNGSDLFAVGALGDGWHLIGAAGEPAFQNSWTNYGGTWGPARFKKIGGEVILQGLVAGGTNGAVGFTLPAGYRPGYDELFEGRNGRFAGAGGTGYEGASRKNVLTTGAVVLNAENAYNTYVTLNGIRFVAEQ